MEHIFIDMHIYFLKNQIAVIMGIQNPIELIFPGLPKTPETSEYFLLLLISNLNVHLPTHFPFLRRSKSYFWNSDFLIKQNQESQQFSLLKDMLAHVRECSVYLRLGQFRNILSPGTNPAFLKPTAYTLSNQVSPLLKWKSHPLLSK